MMKLTFEHGLDDFRWDTDKQPAPGKRFRDKGVQFWLDGELLSSVAERNEDARKLQDHINYMMIQEGWPPYQIRNHLLENREKPPYWIPESIEIA